MAKIVEMRLSVKTDATVSLRLNGIETRQMRVIGSAATT